MAHFAKLDNLGVVVFVTFGRDEDDGKELELCARTNNTYRQTSYNTHGGIYYDPITGIPSIDQSKSFRKNFARVGYKYDIQRDAFIPPKPFNSWILNEVTCLWEAPTPLPQDAGTGDPPKLYRWNEDNITWDEIVPGNT